ncbi:hypothetical protein FRB94_013038 [Tulasnella sp. JGI-2019a]|nr:hypothetical protein FRB93_001882 [Tulasnella sp. JGI-2019a]KAG9008631.1 hypothetical protein FRB94_013038 [Tulasnella sp. JGI-2019a]KAG9033822.1 hypothetical protein FRB95_014144 [Tulasnella sp. JGI-2019a]
MIKGELKGSNKRTCSVVLGTPEILKKIMLFSPHKECTVSARVSSTWNPIALDVLWYELPSVYPLLELLAPLGWDSAQELGFPKFVNPLDWEHFHSYAQRVRYVTWDGGEHSKPQKGYTGGHLSWIVFSNIYLDNPTVGPLLPNLSTLRWTVRNNTTALQLLPFLFGSIKDLQLDFRKQCSSETVNSILHRLGTREPGIINFHLSTHHDVDKVDKSLAACLQHTTELQMVMLLRRFGAPRVVGALKDLKHLHSIFLVLRLVDGRAKGSLSLVSNGICSSMHLAPP